MPYDLFLSYSRRDNGQRGVGGHPHFPGTRGVWPRLLRQRVDGPVCCPEEPLDSVKNKVSGAHR
jgi:hypothetical protein